MVSRASKNVKYLITGISGFVGGHYLEYLAKHRPDVEVVGVDEREPELDFLDASFKGRVKFHKGSLLDRSFLEDLIKYARPDRIVHLASYSSVAFSWQDPVSCFVNNTNIFLNIVEAVRRAHTDLRILSIGSSEEYGIVRKEDLPLREEAPLNPISPYAVARLSQEKISLIYARGYGLPVICTRSFNHIGPRQRDVFAVSSFAKQVAEAKKGLRHSIKCGDLTVVRDFIDVRDVVRAYDLLLDAGKSGEIYNVCSGEGHSLSDIAGMLQKIAGTAVPLEKDASLIRPADNPAIIGSSEKLKRDVGFAPQYALNESLADVVDYWEAHAG